MHLPTALTVLVAAAQSAVLLPFFHNLIDSDVALWCASVIHCVIGLITLASLTIIHAPYGRYAADTIVPVTVSTRAAWIVQELPTIAAVLYHSSCNYLLLGDESGRGASGPTIGGVVMLGAFCLHYIHRSLVFPWFLRPKKPTPIHVMLLANLYCSFNGTLQVAAAWRFGSVVEASTPSDVWRWWWTTAACVALFGLGMATNLHSDYTLLWLRKSNSASAKVDTKAERGGQAVNTVDGYSIPYGGLYRWVSCPNFFGEAVEWLGYALLAAHVSGMSSPTALAAFSFFLYTVCNTFPRGWKHHHWYLDHFGAKYASLGRKAVIPFVI